MHGKYIYPSLPANIFLIFIHFSMTSHDTQEFSLDQGIRHIFQKVINGKYGNCDLDYLQHRTIQKI